MYALCAYSVVSNSLRPRGLQPTHQAPLSINFSGKNTGAGFHFLLQGTFLTQGLNPMSPALTGRFFTTVPSGKPNDEW